MDFGQKKLPKEAADTLRVCPVDTIRPFALMMAPAYVYMKLNEKYVMVKSPLDFFTEEELARLKPFETFFFPQDVDVSIRFRKVANDIKALLSWSPDSAILQEIRRRSGEDGSVREHVALPPTSYETSDAVIRLVAPLWETGPTIDPFFVAVFVNELCDEIPPETLKAYRDQSIVDYEKAVIYSSWAVFLALHLGYNDLSFLNRLRLRIMDEVVAKKLGPSVNPEIHELVRAARESLGAEVAALPGTPVRADALRGRFGRTSEKLTSRFRRVEGLTHV